MRKYLTILMLVAMVAVCFGLVTGCDEGEDPATQMLQSNGGSTSAAPVETPPVAEIPPVEETAAQATENGDAGSAVEAAGEALAEDGVEEAAAEGEDDAAGEAEVEAGEEGATEEEPADEAGAAEEGAADGAVEEGTEESEAPAGEDEGIVEEEGAGEEEGIAEDEGIVEDEEGFIAEEDEFISDDPIENFKNLDPRDIIVRKYDDMEGRKTEPWNEELPEEFIPETGRVDPMTRVMSSVPEELKPPRAGETDQNDINSYLVASEATTIVEGIVYGLQCLNVLQVGLEKYATFSYYGGRFILQEGQGTGFTVGSSTGIPIQIVITVSSISTDQVVVVVSASGQGTAVRISKNAVFIPANQF